MRGCDQTLDFKNACQPCLVLIFKLTRNTFFLDEIPQNFRFLKARRSEDRHLGGMRSVTPQQVKTSKEAEQMLLYDMENENVTVRNYRERVRQCEALGEFAIAEQLRDILVSEQEHQIDLATALGKDVAELAHLGQ